MAGNVNHKRGSPGKKINYHKGGIYSRYNKRDGKTYYYIRYTLTNGRRKKEKAGSRKKAAQDLLEQRRTEIRQGTYKDSQKEAEAHIIFGEFADRFMREYANLRRSDHYSQNLRPMREYFGSKTMLEICRADLDKFSAWRSRQVGPSTLRKNLTALGTVFKMAVRWGVLEASPAVDLQKPAEPHHKTVYLTQEQFAQLLDASPPWIRPILRVAVSQGFRLKEAVSLRWEDIDTRAGVLYVNEDNKTGRPDPVPLTEEARKILAEQDRVRRAIGRELGRVFPFVFIKPDGKDYTGENDRIRISKVTKGAMRAIGRPDCSFHSLRHTTASWLVQRGIDLARVREFMRHRSIQTTLRYAHLHPDHLRDTVAALDEALRSGPNSAPCSGEGRCVKIASAATRSSTKSS